MNDRFSATFAKLSFGPGDRIEYEKVDALYEYLIDAIGSWMNTGIRPTTGNITHDKIIKLLSKTIGFDDLIVAISDLPLEYKRAIIAKLIARLYAHVGHIYYYTDERFEALQKSLESIKERDDRAKLESAIVAELKLCHSASRTGEFSTTTIDKKLRLVLSKEITKLMFIVREAKPILRILGLKSIGNRVNLWSVGGTLREIGEIGALALNLRERAGPRIFTLIDELPRPTPGTPAAAIFTSGGIKELGPALLWCIKHRRQRGVTWVRRQSSIYSLIHISNDDECGMNLLSLVMSLTYPELSFQSVSESFYGFKRLVPRLLNLNPKTKFEQVRKNRVANTAMPRQIFLLEAPEVAAVAEAADFDRRFPKAEKLNLAEGPHGYIGRMARYGKV